MNLKGLLALLFLTVLTIPSPGQNKKPDETFAKTSSVVPVVLIHGIGGSNLRQGNLPKGVFGDGGFPNDVLRGPAGKPKNLQFTTRGVPRSDSMSATAIADKFYDVPGKNITDLSKYLVVEKKYVRDQTLFEFAYDFRHSVEFNSEKLAALIEEIKSSSGSAFKRIS